MDEPDRIRAVVAEMRAAELVEALRRACNGDRHWRIKAQCLLDEIDRCAMEPGDVIPFGARITRGKPPNRE
jgi:hypothetical protein